MDKHRGCVSCGAAVSAVAGLEFSMAGRGWLYAVMAGPGMVPSLPIWNPLLAAHSRTSDVLACHCEPVIGTRLACPGDPDGLADKVAGASV